MHKDFPSKLFSSEKAQGLLERESASVVESKTNYDLAERVSKLTYNYPQEVTFNLGTGQADCLTQMYSASSLLRQTSGMLPWGLANKIQLGYDLYFDLSSTENRQLKVEMDYYFAECKGTLGRFYPSLFVKGMREIGGLLFVNLNIDLLNNLK